MDGFKYADFVLSFAASMLQEKPHARPNIFQVVREVCLMRGTDVPIKDVGRPSLLALKNLTSPDLQWASYDRSPAQSTASIAAWTSSFSTIGWRI